jgi:hypothetical protein
MTNKEIIEEALRRSGKHGLEIEVIAEILAIIQEYPKTPIEWAASMAYAEWDV